MRFSPSPWVHTSTPDLNGRGDILLYFVRRQGRSVAIGVSEAPPTPLPLAIPDRPYSPARVLPTAGILSAYR